MRALTFHAPGDIRCETVPDPAPEAPDEVVVRVTLAGLCGSDLHAWRGHETGLDAGTVVGHEFVGEVVARGKDVRGLEVGTRVTSPFTTSCGACFFCREGLTSRCSSGALFGWVEGGHGLGGAQAELVRVPLAESTLVPVPEDLELEPALLLGDVLPTGWYCAERGEVGPRTTVAVVGAGPIGCMAVLACRELGVERVYAVDLVPERLALAAGYGATPVAVAEDPVAVLREATQGRGADVVLEAVGSPRATRLAFDLARPGGTVSAAGVHTEEHFAFSPGEAYDKNLTYRAGRCPARATMARLLDRLRSATWDVSRIVSHRLPLEDGPRAYGMFDAKEDGCTKVLLRP